MILLVLNTRNNIEPLYSNPTCRKHFSAAALVESARRIFGGAPVGVCKRKSQTSKLEVPFVGAIGVLLQVGIGIAGVG